MEIGVVKWFDQAKGYVCISREHGEDALVSISAIQAGDFKKLKSGETVKFNSEAGGHFGRQIKRWNPKIKDSSLGEDSGINIIDVQRTLKIFKNASKFVQDSAGERKTILFVGTQRQAQDAIAEEAGRCGMFYVNNRWLGGLLTNWATVQKSVKRLKDLDEMATDGRYALLPKKEVIKLERERKHLQANLAGIKSMNRLPDIVFVIDSNKEAAAVKEARKLGIPVVDTNGDPTEVDWVIPGNDEALRAIRLFASKVADSIAKGVQAATDEQTAETAGAATATKTSPASADLAEQEELNMEKVLDGGVYKTPEPESTVRETVPETGVAAHPLQESLASESDVARPKIGDPLRGEVGQCLEEHTSKEENSSPAAPVYAADLAAAETSSTLGDHGMLRSIGKKLGVRTTLKSDADLVALVEERIPLTAIAALMEHGILEKEIYSVIVPRRTLQHRRARKERLSCEESDRAVRLARLAALTEKAFASQEAGMHWLRTPKKRFRGRTPIDMIATEAGSRLVEEALYQIDEGMAA